MQTDLHLGNFLWDGVRVYAIDPAAMRFRMKPLGNRGSIAQLAALIMGLPKRYQTRASELQDAYCQGRGWSMNEALTARIRSQTQRAIRRSLPGRLRRSLRTSKRNVRAFHGEFWGVFDKTFFENTNLSIFLTTLDQAMEDGDILKRGNTCFVCKIR
ncbi:MAG TPA: hypothetical protein VLH60_04640, partial [Sedimentisphaerales bacterium]|nr:hypothetical protein [Sedimentisphaerales bacterium]